MPPLNTPSPSPHPTFTPDPHLRLPTDAGDNDAQLDRINVFYHEASGGKYVPRSILFGE